MKKVVRGIVMALLVLAILANGALAAFVFVTREPAPKPLNAERVTAASKPATVFIQSNYTVTTSLAQPKIDQDAIDRVLIPRIYSGEITSEAQAQQAAYALFFSNPDVYVKVGQVASDTWDYWATGSGFYVTEDGYIVTAAHVVSASKTEIRDSVVAGTKSPTFISDFKNQLKKDYPDYALSDAEVTTYLDFWQRWVARYLAVDKIDAKYYIGTGASVQAGDNIQTTGARASVVSIDPTTGGHDIAILKAQVSGVPALPIESTDPNLGDATYAMGYPRTAYLEETVPTNQSVPIVVTVGKVQHMNSLSNSSGSWKVYGTDAQFTHGDSGGPVVDAKGNVIGVISYIIPDASGNQLPGQGYFEPASFIREDLAKANVTIPADPKHLNITATYYKALAKGDNARYRDELNLLLSIQTRSTTDAYVSDDINRVRNDIVAGNDKTPMDVSSYVLPTAGSGAGVIVLALLSWIVLALTVGRKRKQVPVVAEASPATEEAALPPIEAITPQPSVAATEPLAIVAQAEPVAESPSPVAEPPATAADETPPPVAPATPLPAD